ncbi:hypothetical protein H3146_02880 [Streptomyces sp. OF3]|uniref:HTH luxR-type domain-containing protein n=1 Tax=Streptomyces alkaliterrae TaxID=2213162 RepID=A0A7W3WH78_9ACTN|nr:helix-turn-helix transcriptional regulator [Streptomyces alkaliterrae]MBB1252317.1 hypothetical protein [Streptomyces alkaliterrae]
MVGGFDWPVVARESELAEIEQCTAMRMGALLVGAPGVGKSRLLEAAVERAARTGARVLRPEELDKFQAQTPRHRTQARPQPIVIALDDVHLADRVAFEPAHRMAHSGRALLLATTEPGAALPDELRRLLVGGRMRRLAVEALNRSGAARMLSTRLAGPVAVDSAERFWELSHGYPLVLRELVDQGLADGTLRQAGGFWHWSGFGGTPSGRLVDLVDLMLGDLDANERELVNMLGLAGTLEAGLSVVTESGDAAESLNRRGLVVARRSGLRLTLRLTHPLCEAVIAATLPELTARRLRVRIADAIERTGARRPNDAARVVRLRLGTRRPPGPDNARKAAVDALRARDYPLAELLCRSVPAEDTDDRLLATLGEALAGQRRHIEAEACLSSVPQLAAVPRARALNLAFGLGRLAEAEAVAGRDQGVRALVRLFKDRIAEARELADSAVDAVPALSALLHHESGDGERALAVLRRGLPALSGLRDGDRHDTGLCAADLLEHHFLTGWITLDTQGPAAIEAAPAGLRERAADGDPRARMFVDLIEARILRLTGRTGRAVEALRRAAAHRGPVEWLAPRPWRIAQLAGAVAESGDAREAASLLEQAREAEREERQHPLTADAMALEAALVTAWLGDRRGAARQALETAGRALAAGRRHQGLAALHLAARAGQARGALVLWRARHEGVSAVDDVRLQHVLGLADDDGRSLDAVSLRFAAMGLLPLAAEAAAAARRAHETSDDHRAARASRATSAELLSRCGAALPEWAPAADGRGPRGRPRSRAALTLREREVATLAVSLSNQEIADRLGLSVRTVENHLYRAYGKLAVTTRTDLAPRLGVAPARRTRIA